MATTKDDVQRQIEEFQRHIAKMKERANKAQFQFVTTVCNEVERTAKELMRDTEVNQNVTYGKRGHHPSLPGNAPAVDSGLLRQSVTHSIELDGKNNVTGYVGSVINDPPYPLYLEFGTSKMKPRPWLSAAVIKCQTFIKEVSGRLFRQVGKK